MRNSLLSRIVLFVALLATALAMGAALAHLLELPNKIDLTRDQYFLVQQVYRGWAMLAVLLLIQLVAMLVLAALARRAPRVLRATLVAILCLVLAQAMFWAFTFPANVATDNWTTIPDDWEALRRQWEYSHAVGAVFQILAMSALIVAALAREPAAA
ncbi:MAG: DUF1772 domain-containing protein [Hyphomicrobiales bacterium]|nr:DUF1772 domain-containing protein [Hyphomicrobiales bacterium]